ncbi:Aste57867_21788 [Aphanomyces stellatus]|uniref:Aste57867_21788 protein n=1 Tax=Aphanomyces stellatus TaxID=120398 RepID=A0A485LNB6_9STRA|nr:hypothetical protein As57867_021719 [Aphanomyces stellatus]VFT98457.1 Aste57867_21788 [Aphanomyces stellatus]
MNQSDSNVAISEFHQTMTGANLPSGALEEILRKHIPSEVDISNGVLHVVNACAQEFMRSLLTDANSLANEDSKDNHIVRITPSRITEALASYPDLLAKMPPAEEDAKSTSGVKRKARAGKPKDSAEEEEMRAEQEALFARAAKSQYGRAARHFVFWSNHQSNRTHSCRRIRIRHKFIRMSPFSGPSLGSPKSEGGATRHRRTIMAVSLQDKQKETLLRMLEFNVDVAANDSAANADRWGEQWKVLVYDHFCRDIISPVLKLHELRKKGVTLHMLLENEREEIPDVPAIYFVQPTSENLQRIIQDGAKELYSTMHINFATPIPRDRLEFFAKGCVDSGCTSMISKVFDQHSNFISLEPQLFSLNQSGSYVACNDARTSDATIEQTMRSITQGLFSVLATLGSIPVIRCPNSDGPSRLVAEQLNQTLRDHLTKRSGVFQDSGASFQRPVLIIVDRNEDLTSMLHHPSTYQARSSHMRVFILVAGALPNEKGQLVEKSLDLDVKSDKFFETNAGLLFPDAIAGHEDELKVVLKKEKDIAAKAGGGNMGQSTKDLVAAVDTLPALLEKKKTLEVHTNVFQATMDAVTQRQVPEFSMLEQRLIEGFNVPKADVVALLHEKGSAEDKVRLLLIYYLTSGASGGEISELEATLAQDGALGTFESAWKYIKQHSSLQKHAAVGSSFADSATATAGTNTASKLKGLANNWAGSFAGQAQGWLSQAAEQFKNFLPENKKLQLTRVTDAICDIKANTEDETFLYLDPKIKAAAGGAIPRQRTPFREAIVFVIGGGSYNEYQNLQAYAKAQPAAQPRSILYGCTELLTPNEFLHQLNQVHT